MAAAWAALGLLAFILLTVGGAVVAGGLMIGVLSTVGYLLVHRQLPMFLRRTIAHFHIVVDIFLGLIVYRLFSNNTATALIGAVSNSILISIYLNYERQHLLDNDHNVLKVLDIRNN